jgi:anti-sigma regulatory factor (Ser/Thr protein kinase)
MGTSGEFAAYTHLREATSALTGADDPGTSSGPHRSVFSVACDRSSPGVARSELAKRIEGAVDPATAQTAVLLISEAVTNAVLHGCLTSDGTVDIEVDLCADRLWVGVSNTGQAFDHHPAQPSWDDDHGRGLFLVDALAGDWGTGHASGTTSVWFELDRGAAVPA